MADRVNNKMIRRRLANAYLSSIVSISLVLLLIGAASLIVINSNSVAKYLRENMKLSVILKINASDEDAASYSKSIQTFPFVKETNIISREQGQKELEEILGKDFLSVFESNPIPISVDVKLKAEYVDSDSLKFVTKTLTNSPLVDEIDSQQNLIEALNQNLRKITIIFAAIILLLLFISFALISNMVRLSVFARRFTIHTMKLVGATKAFIRKPFINASIIQGLIAASVASGILYLLSFTAKKTFAEIFNIFDSVSVIYTIGIIFVSGVLICMISTFFVVNKLVGATKDELYY